jgi:hypothetical protein
MSGLKGGDKLEAKLRELSAKVSKPGKLRAGFLEGATYPDGTPVAMVAAIQEFGAPKVGIPPRLGFRNMIAVRSSSWGEAVEMNLVATDYDVDRTLSLVGDGIKGRLQQTIVDTMGPPLSPVTLMLRKMKSENPDLKVAGATVGEAARRVAAGESTGGVSTKPLVESAHMLNSVDYEVKE